MSRSLVDSLYKNFRVAGLVALLCALVAAVGCGGALSSSHGQQSNDPLGLGVEPGPLGSTNPQTLEVRLGSEPSDRIVSLSLTINSLKITNSVPEDLELVVAPATVEFTRSAINTDPILVRSDIYQDTYSQLIIPNMTGQVVFYDNTNHLVTQSLSVTGKTVPLGPLVLGGSPQVLSVSLDLAQSFSVGAGSVTVNPIVVSASNAVAAPPVAPTVGQPETGSVSFLVGTVTATDTGAKTISLQPTSGEALQLSYDGSTQFINCDPSMLTGLMIETEGVTQSQSLGAVLATTVTMIDHSASSSELYGLLSGYAPDGMSYNLIAEGGAGLNVTTGLIGKNITLDWLAAGYSVNHGRIPASLSLFDEGIDGTLVFDETRTFPGQMVEVEWDTLIVPDPGSSNAGYIQPRMIELEEQTLSGQVAGYVYDPETQTGTFTLNVASNAAIKSMNPGLTTITVDMIPQTYLRSNPTFNDGDTVKVRGLLFAGCMLVDAYGVCQAEYSNVNYHPGDPVAFTMVADRISK